MDRKKKLDLSNMAFLDSLAAVDPETAAKLRQKMPDYNRELARQRSAKKEAALNAGHRPFVLPPVLREHILDNPTAAEEIYAQQYAKQVSAAIEERDQRFDNRHQEIWPVKVEEKKERRRQYEKAEHKRRLAVASEHKLDKLDRFKTRGEATKRKALSVLEKPRESQPGLFPEHFHELARQFYFATRSGLLTLDTIPLPRRWHDKHGRPYGDDENFRPACQKLLDVVFTAGKMAMHNRGKAQWCRAKVPERFRLLGAVTLSNKCLAIMTGYSKSSIKAAKKRLCESGYLIRIMLDCPSRQKTRRLPAMLIAAHPATLHPSFLWTQGTEQGKFDEVCSYPSVETFGRDSDRIQLCSKRRPKGPDGNYKIVRGIPELGILLEPAPWFERCHRPTAPPG